METLMRTNDVVLLSYVSHLLDQAGIHFEVFDGYISAVEGSIGAFPRRVVVAEEDLVAARRVLGNASLTITG